jgi:N-acetylneuraminate synthase/N,N'-diacetyllegionaminate synthase
MIFLSTPYDVEDADLLDQFGVQAFKVASGQAVEPYFLKHLAKKERPIFLSTGMCTLAEVDEAVRAIRGEGNEQIVILQCTTNYPSRLADTNLRAMQTMGQALNVICGYSDHTRGDVAAIGAVALGAQVIEKHFTLDKDMAGPDHSSSANPAEFKQLVKRIREMELCLGSGIKQPSAIELKNSIGMRRSIVARRLIPAGVPLSWDNITLKRPGNGLSSRHIELIIGRTAQLDIAADTIITLEMIK